MTRPTLRSLHPSIPPTPLDEGKWSAQPSRGSRYRSVDDLLDIAPAISSASPPEMTTLVSPSAESPAVSAKGTVSPSERPMIASDITRASTLNFFFSLGSGSESVQTSEELDHCDSTSPPLGEGVQPDSGRYQIRVSSLGVLGREVQRTQGKATHRTYKEERAHGHRGHPSHFPAMRRLAERETWHVIQVLASFWIWVLTTARAVELEYHTKARRTFRECRR